MTLSIVPDYHDGAAHPELTEDQRVLEATALMCIQGGRVGPRRGNSATRLQRVRMELWAAMSRGEQFVSVDRLMAVVEGDTVPDPEVA